MDKEMTIFEQITANTVTIKDIEEKIELLSLQAEHMLEAGVSRIELTIEEIATNGVRPFVQPLYDINPPNEDSVALGYAKFFKTKEDMPDISVMGVIITSTLALKFIDQIIIASKDEIKSLEATNEKLIRDYRSI